MEELEIPDIEINEWLAVLKPYQASSLNALIESSSPESAAEIWITANGPDNTIMFGGERDTKPFWDKFKEEFKKFVCGDAEYSEERRALLVEAPISNALMVSAISSAIGAKIGYAAALLSPAVVILLYSIGKMGKNAYCNDS
ncbi:hypothetical protein CR161_07455 [Prosthecochloris sp. ZM]|uniref:hypothetical protein n=1 Tax=Prosthecochloris sp. ZM TaxID=2283143 RepID=UPI000DF787D1|nr:hypothetical protein [Prosthecochloris sp. ZM]RDD30561.1 hypothetical protein CR161_07455 [Prosthecochloris sp. ZM]